MSSPIKRSPQKHKSDLLGGDIEEPTWSVPCNTCGEAPCKMEVYSVEVHETEDHIGLEVNDEETLNNKKRFNAYTYFTHLLYRSLGKGNRIEVPVCIVDHFKSLWPEDDKTKYTGFKDNSNESE